MAQFPNYIQAALLFDKTQAVDIDSSVREFLASEEKAGTRYTIVEHIKRGTFLGKRGVFWRLYGSNDVMITVEIVDGPADSSKFKTALSSSFTRMAVKDAADRIARHKSHVIVNVHHGVMPHMPEFSEFLKKIEMPPTGFSLSEFRLRLRLCGLMSQFTQGLVSASLVHWTLSDLLFTGEAFSKLAILPAPGPLHIHPLLYGAGKNLDGRDEVVVLTHGVAHFLGREVLVLANPVPWPSVLQTILAFVTFATMEKGYIIPDGDTFGDEEKSICCRVTHIPDDAEALNFKGPLYQLEVLRSREHSYTSLNYKGS